MKKAKNIAIIEPVSYGANEYVINGVRYMVEYQVFQLFQLQERYKRHLRCKALCPCRCDRAGCDA